MYWRLFSLNLGWPKESEYGWNTMKLDQHGWICFNVHWVKQRNLGTSQFFVRCPATQLCSWPKDSVWRRLQCTAGRGRFGAPAQADMVELSDLNHKLGNNSCMVICPLRTGTCQVMNIWNMYRNSRFWSECGCGTLSWLYKIEYDTGPPALCEWSTTWRGLSNL